MTRKTRNAAVISGAAAMAALFFVLKPADAFDRELWLSDYARLKTHLSAAYANLEWITNHRGLDLRALDIETTRAINEAASAAEARQALHAFVEAFRDPHFYVRDLKQSVLDKLTSVVSSSDDKKIGSEMSARKACDFLGFDSRDLGFDLKFEIQPAYRKVSSDDVNPFRAGVLKLESGKTLGIVRIAHFGEDGYPEVCREAWNDLSPNIDELCGDGWCGGFYMSVRDRLLAYLSDRIGQLREIGYDTLVIDITGNGGGTDWVHAAAEIVSPKRLTCSRSSFVKHPHWTKIMASMIGDVEAELTRDDLPEKTREALQTPLANLRDLHAQTESPCDLSALWEGSGADPGCSNIVDGQQFTCGLFPSLEPGALEGVNNPGLYYKAMENEYTPHVNEQPLVVLIDWGTASASELFASVLQGSRAAVLVGSRSYGAGCGFVNGGIPLTLEHAGLKVMAPDCVRFGADGVNEIEGMQPDLELRWSRNDSRRARTEMVVKALGSLD
jgi:hypothetical protein